MKALKYSFYLCAFSLVLSACGSSGGGGSSDSDKTTNLTYYESDGTCYKASTNESVSSNNCTDLKFFIDDGECFRESDDKKVSISNCTGNQFIVGRGVCYDRSANRVDNRSCNDDGNVGGNSSSRRRVCEGPHLFFSADDILEGDCDGQRDNGNCSGYLLFDIEKQEFVDCL